MTNREYYADKPKALAEQIDRIIESVPQFSGRTSGELIAEFLDAECSCRACAEGETDFVVTLQVVNTVRGTITDVMKTADELAENYRRLAKSVLTDCYGDARDADDVSLRGVQVFPSNLKTD